MNDDQNRITYFAQTDSRNKRVKFGIKKNDRSKHMYLIGKTGMGKSTLLENMAIQDIQNGEGLAFMDPHGNTADLLLEYVPEHRIKDVLYFAPFDMEYPVSFNVMEDIGIERRHLVVSGLMSAFKKIWVDAWSARMEYILNNIMLALLETPGSTLLGVNRMLADKDFRKKIVDNITDPSVRSFWVDEYANYSERFAQEAAPAIQNKVGQFVTNPLVRNIIGQSNSTFDIRKMMDEKKILIINLSKGRVGEANANLLGSMLVTKIYLAAMSRADANEAEMAKLPNFYLYVDEFQSFANESFADILSEARKYKLNLTIAHQYIDQMQEEVRMAVFGNVGTMVTFRVGAYDGEVLEKEFMPQFTATDIVSLGRFQAYMKLMIDGVSSQPFSAETLPRIAKPEHSYRNEIIEHSRRVFARPRKDVEEEIKAWHLEGNEHNHGEGGGGRSSGGGKGRGGERSGDRGGDRGARSGDRRDGAPRPSVHHRGDGLDVGRMPVNNSRPEGNRAPRIQTENSLNTNHDSTHKPNPVQYQTQSSDRKQSPFSNFNSGQNLGKAEAQEATTTSEPQRDQHKIDTQKRETELRQAFSLSFLKSNKEKSDNSQKVAKPENVLALREALLSVVKDSRPEVASDIEKKISVDPSPTPAPVAKMDSTKIAPPPAIGAVRARGISDSEQQSHGVVPPPKPKPVFNPANIRAQPRPFSDNVIGKNDANIKSDNGNSQSLNKNIKEVSADDLKKILKVEE